MPHPRNTAWAVVGTQIVASSSIRFSFMPSASEEITHMGSWNCPGTLPLTGLTHFPQPVLSLPFFYIIEHEIWGGIQILAVALRWGLAL